ncbi:MAG: HNH endonuclease [Patescibacteria group bacterium]|nr:HNH endonuclease [Patescibacteria group bacterium]
MTTVERLLSKAAILENGCWKYTRGLNGRGYGNFWDHGRTRSAHVVSYELFNGSIPHGHSILHKCDYKPCINPDHLFTGTTKDNIDDMIAKGRSKFVGVQNGRAILTEEDIPVIRELLAIKGVTQEAIAEHFKVSVGTISHIKNNRAWGHI